MQFADPPTPGRRTRLLRIPSLRLRRLPRQMVRQAREDGFPGGYDVPAGTSDAQLDREGY